MESVGSPGLREIELTLFSQLRYCPSGLPHFKTIEDFDHLHIIVECEQPNEDLYEFNGSLLIPADKLKEMNGLLSVSSEGPVVKL